MGKNKLTYNGPVPTFKADLNTEKLHWNSVLYTQYGKYHIVYANNFCLNNPMNKAKYYKIKMKINPKDIIDKYDLNNKQENEYIYIRVEKVMHGLVQSGIIAHKELKEHLKPYCYAPEIITQGLCTHQDRNINLNLVVDDFWIR